MKKTVGNALRIWSFIMVFAGIICLALDALLLSLRLHDPDLSRFAVYLGAFVLFACAVLEIIEGIRCIVYLNESIRNRRFRDRIRNIRTFKRLTLFAVLFGTAETVLSCIWGIVFWQLPVLIVSAVLIPLINFLFIRTIQP